MRPVRSDLAAVTAAGREIDRVAGPKLTERLQALGETPLAGAVLTPSEDLEGPAFLIHVVVESPDEPWSLGALERGLTNGLRRAEEFAVESLALPPLGTGAGGLDLQDAARTMLGVLDRVLEDSESLAEVEIVVSSDLEESLFGKGV